MKATKKKMIELKSDHIIFYFNHNRYGYDIDEYYPSISENNFRMRDLIFFFNNLHNQLDGFSKLKLTKQKAWLRKKAITSFVFFLLFFLPALFSLQLIATGMLRSNGTIVIAGIFLSSIALTVQFMIIDHNNSKMDDGVMTAELARNIKVYIKNLNTNLLIILGIS